MKLYLRVKKVTDANKKIIVVLGRFWGGTAGAFAQQKLNKIDGGDDTPSWDAFKAELQLVYSDKTKEVDAEWCIKTFTQEKKYITDFFIEFMALASKAQTNNQYVIFLLKKNVNREIIRAIMAYCKGTISRALLSKFWGPELVARWQFVYCVPTVPGFPCLYHVVRCLLFYI